MTGLIVRSGRKRITLSSFLIHVFLCVLSACFVIPLVVVFIVSITTQQDLTRFGLRLIPLRPTWDAYHVIIKAPETILNAYKVTITTTFISLLLYLFIGSLCAYSLSRRDFALRNIVSFYLFFTMMFSGGLVPYYLLVTKYLELRNTIWSLILPQLGNVWHVFLMRTFFQSISDSIVESATIDGANDWQIYARIMLPLSVPSLATVALLNFVGYWNTWFNALLFIDDKQLRPLQYMLQLMLSNIELMRKSIASGAIMRVDLRNIPSEPLQMAMCVLAIGPVMLIFPFFQKYLVKGIMVGSVKG